MAESYDSIENGDDGFTNLCWFWSHPQGYYLHQLGLKSTVFSSLKLLGQSTVGGMQAGVAAVSRIRDQTLKCMSDLQTARRELASYAFVSHLPRRLVDVDIS